MKQEKSPTQEEIDDADWSDWFKEEDDTIQNDVGDEPDEKVIVEMRTDIAAGSNIHSITNVATYESRVVYGGLTAAIFETSYYPGTASAYAELMADMARRRYAGKGA